MEYARVFEIPADYADGCDVFAEAGYARSQAADSAHVEADFHPCLRRFVKGSDDGLVAERIHLHRDPGLLVVAGALCLVRDEFEKG